MQQGRVALMSYHTQWSCGHEWEGKRGRFPVPAAIVPPLGAYISRSWGGHIFYRCWFIWSTSTVIIRLYIYIFIFILSFIVGVFARLMHWNGLWAQEPRTCSEVKNLHFSFFFEELDYFLLSHGKVAKPKTTHVDHDNKPSREFSHYTQKSSKTTNDMRSFKCVSAVVPSWSGRDPGFTRLVASSSWLNCSHILMLFPWMTSVPVRLQLQGKNITFCVQKQTFFETSLAEFGLGARFNPLWSDLWLESSDVAFEILGISHPWNVQVDWLPLEASDWNTCNSEKIMSLQLLYG